ncbi:uncharacterized protein [Oscarella lobularis]|uniref:uncharacterized protein isoform X2 n=1 Tax=Oscarella lobularis TaxID=121494 RepID=UPI0033137726
MADVLVACKIGDARLLKTILLKQSPRRVDSKGYSPLHHAVRRCYIDCMRLLLDDGRINVDARTKDTGSTPLHLCLSSKLRRRDRLRMVEMLIEKGANVNSCRRGQLTPLHIASREDFSAVDALNHSAFDMAKIWGKRDCARCLAAYQWARQKNEKINKETEESVRKDYKSRERRQVESENRYWQSVAAYERWQASKGVASGPQPQHCAHRKDDRTKKSSDGKCSACVSPVDDVGLDEALKMARRSSISVSLKPATIRPPVSYLLAGPQKQKQVTTKRSMRRRRSASVENLFRENEVESRSAVRSLIDLTKDDKKTSTQKPPSFLSRPSLSNGAHRKTCQAWGSPTLRKPNAFLLGLGSSYPTCVAERRGHARLTQLPMSLLSLQVEENS